MFPYIMNLKIKYRESFRPFAPSVLEEDVANQFEMNNNLLSSGKYLNIFSCSIFVLCALFLLAEIFLKPKKSNKDNNSIIATTLSFILNVYFYF